MFESFLAPTEFGLKETGYLLKRKSPEICLVAGTLAIITGTVMACKVSFEKAPKVAEVHKKNMEKINNQDLTEEQKRRATAKIFLDTCISAGKLYAIPVALEITGLGLHHATYKIQKVENQRLAAYAASISAAFASYREFIRELYGEDADFRALHGIREEVIEVEETDENGKTRKKKKKVPVATAKESPYLRYFTKSNNEWKGTDDLNELFFRSTEAWANDKLRINGRLTLEELFRAFNFKIDPKDPMCLGVGWIYDEDNPMGDNRIVIDRHKVWLHNDFGELEEAWAIDFNVDGDIYKELCSRDINAIGTGNAEKDILNLKTLEGGM